MKLIVDIAILLVAMAVLAWVIAPDDNDIGEGDD